MGVCVWSVAIFHLDAGALKHDVCVCVCVCLCVGVCLICFSSRLPPTRFEHSGSGARTDDRSCTN